VEELAREVEDDDARPLDVVGNIFFFFLICLMICFFLVISVQVFFFFLPALLEICAELLTAFCGDGENKRRKNDDDSAFCR
jgi:hypothetical protein